MDIDMALDDIIKNSKKQAEKSKNKTTPKVERSLRGPVHRRVEKHSSRSRVVVRVAQDQPNRRSREREGRILISNLNPRVIKQDLQQLFKNVTGVRMHQDRSGRPEGTADIFFESHRDAVLAEDKYQHVPLDGYALQIRLISRPDESIRSGRAVPHGDRRLVVSSRNSSSAVGSDRRRRVGRERVRSGRPQSRMDSRKRSESKPISNAMDLDADLDSYMMKE